MVQSSLGQTILKLMNNFLWIVEKCAEWSLPDQEIDLAEGTIRKYRAINRRFMLRTRFQTKIRKLRKNRDS